jgi:hypothetical protein
MRGGTAAGALLLAITACAVSGVNQGQNLVAACGTDLDCPPGFHCNAGGCQILPRLCARDAECDSGQRCRNQSCLPANLSFCEPCLTAAECRSGLCIRLGPDSTACGQSCVACPLAASCQSVVDPFGSGAGVACLPSAEACARYDGGTSGFAYIRHNLFQSVCVSCHAVDAGAAFGNLDLVTDPYHALLGQDGQGLSASNIVGSESRLLRVKPGDPTNSLLYIKMVLIAYDPLYGDSMPPPPMAPSSPALVTAVKSWIAAGAPNN